ncbi:MAG: SPOR domain-containing protein, partial [Flavobacteriaceae bacterium]|nr:SPOR domain-containing protein [Flavobacteriaceae bacterium]
QYHSARIEDHITFYPPGKTVGFNRQLQTNDGLLANHIASVEGCSYEVALHRVRNYASKLSSQLNKGEEVVLEGIGHFTRSDDHRIVFAPSEDHNFSKAAFGLSPINCATIAREAYKKGNENSDTETPFLFTPEKRTAPYLKYAAIGVIAIALSGFGGMKWYESEVKEHNFAEKQKADSLVDHQIQEATFTIEAPLPTLTIEVPKHSGRYHIVAGAFRVKENAAKKVAQLAQRGYQAKDIGTNRYGLHQVIYSSYEDRREALQALRTIKRAENEDAWLLVQKLQ